MEIGNSLSNPQTWVRAKELFGSAMAAYGHAYSLADASVGDDVAGLLQNWGAGLSSLAVHTLDPEEALLAHEQAMEKLRNAAKLRPTDSSIFIAIGEACCAHVDRVQVAVSLKLLATAIEEGFGTALRIDSACLDSVLGRAEAHLAAGRINASAGMDFDAQNHHNLSLNYYLNALQILKADTRNGCKLKFEEQCNVLYNIACVAALCNKESIAAEALTLLVQVGGLSPSDLADDSDFQNLRPKEWFVSLQKH
ncbi:hypothetical protein KP509_1Z194800 [Ceratopteris richardii]|nr:hypothetical protein KP509_1Z194800 [Ceratopteris richardii]